MKKKLLSLLLALSMVLSLAACGSNGGNGNNGGGSQDPNPPSNEDPAGPTGGEDEQQPSQEEEELPGFPLTYDEDTLYEMNFGEYYELYNEAKAADDLDTSHALMAIAEAKLLQTGLVIPGTHTGSGYAMQRMSTHGVTTVSFGNDAGRMHQYNVVDADKIIPAAQIQEINDNWRELCGTGTFAQWVRDYLTEKGYTLRDTYNGNYGTDPANWDTLATDQTATNDVLCNTYDGLMIYNVENEQKPGLALDYEVSEDGKTYTFHLREGVKWVDSQGREIDEVQADDFVAGMQHMLDAKGGLEWLVDGLIVNAAEYANGEITDFSQVGVKAVDKYTLEYTLTKRVLYFPTMLSFNTFAPLCRSYYESMGGKFGADYDYTASDYDYGKGPDSIVYCGPFLITSYTAKNSVVFQQNPTYWDIDNCTIKTATWTYNDGADVTRNYNDFLNGKIDSCTIGISTVELAKDAGLFDEYVRISGSNSRTSYFNFNLARRMYHNFNDETRLVSPQEHGSVDEILAGAETSSIVDSAARTHAAVNNKHFRLAMGFALDRSSYMAQTVGDQLAPVRLRNTFVPGDFVRLENDTTVDINGTPTTFPAGTCYGEIVQAQLTADGFPAKVWDESVGAEDASTGFDGWFNVDNAKAEFEIAVAELAAQGVEVSAENPIYIDLVFGGMTTEGVNQAEVYRQSMENAFGGAIKVNLMAGASWEEVDNAAFYPEAGADHNMDVGALNFSWGAVWGDPDNYLDLLMPAGAQINKFGLF